MSFVVSEMPVTFGYFKYGYNGFYNFHPGISMVCHLSSLDSRRVCNAFLEEIPQETHDILKIAREGGYKPYSEVPEYVTTILDLEHSKANSSRRY